MADALSQETRIKSGAPQESVIGPILFLLLDDDLQSVINVTTLLLADDVKMVSPRSQIDLLQGSLYNVWNWSVNWGLPINLTKMQLYRYRVHTSSPIILATGSPGESAQFINFIKDPGVLTDSSFPTSNQSMACSVYDKAVFRSTILVRN